MLPNVNQNLIQLLTEIGLLQEKKNAEVSKDYQIF